MYALAALALLTSAQDVDEPFQLSFTPPKFDAKRPLLRLKGASTLPDDVVLFLSTTRKTDVLAGGKIESSPPEIVGGSMVRVAKGGYVLENAIDGPGVYVVEVHYRKELQRPTLSQLNPKVTRGTFKFHVWEDAWLTDAAGALTELQALITQGRELVEKFSAATATEEIWKDQAKYVTVLAAAWRSKLASRPLKRAYPLSLGELNGILRNLVEGADDFTFQNGRFVGAVDALGNFRKTYRGDAWTWANYKRYADEVPAVAGRELALWLIRDLRRTSGKPTPSFVEALASRKEAPGLSPWAERLGQAGLADLDVLETKIRAAGP